MLSGLKFISQDELNKTEQNFDSDSSQKERKKTSKKGTDRGKKKNDCYGCSDSEEIEKLSKGSKRRKKCYSFDASSSSLSESEAESDSDCGGKWYQKRRTNKREGKQRKGRTKHGKKSKKRSKSTKEAFSHDSLSENYSDSDDGHHLGGKDKPRKRSKCEKEKSKERKDRTDEGVDFDPQDNKGLARKEMGLEWMLKPMNQSSPMATKAEDPPEEKLDEVKKPNPKELNPYLRDNGSGYPDDASQASVDAGQLPSHLVVGDGGASWRLKALKRAQEQAAREGRKLDEVVGERWGSLGSLAVSTSSHSAAHAHAHLHAIRDRKKGLSEKQKCNPTDQNENTIRKISGNKVYLQDSSARRHEMKEPKVHDSLTWGKRKATKKMSSEDAQVISSAAKHLNKFANDGSFLDEFQQQQKSDTGGSRSPIGATCEGNEGMDIGLITSKDGNSGQADSVIKQTMTANQLAAKVLQLRMKGKIEEAEKLSRETEVTALEQESKAKAANDRTRKMSRYAGRISSSKQEKGDEDADMHLARTIMKNKQYSASGQADDEYDFEGAPSKKQSRKRERIPESERSTIVKRFLTEQERCQFCFENPSRPKHLVMSIANFTYLMLPQWQPVVPGHCYILPMQHESATRTVDNNVWEEIRNFKKCLIMMFAKQEKDVIFLETVMGLAKQRRHCLVECIPLPCEVAKEAPLYFKKAIDEAEDEWSQHNAKRLIDTSEKGLRSSIPKGFPYFHVEFGLNKGFVHVIDDETQFKSNLGLNVIRGMLRLPEEDMYRRRKHDSVETQKQAVAMFAREWEPFDWTKQLD